MIALKYTLFCIGCYLLGNVFFARIISKIRHQDITNEGSGNPGTMNMLRKQGFWVGLLTLLLDMSKGVAAALVGYYLFGGPNNEPASIIAQYVGGLCVLVGNLFPVFYKFKGGKGAAVIYGMFCAVNPFLGLILFGVGFIYLFAFDYASMTSFIVITVFVIVQSQRPAYQGNLIISFLLLAIYLLIWFAHRSNILRLLTGKENKVNFRDKLRRARIKLAKKKEEKTKREIG